MKPRILVVHPDSAQIALRSYHFLNTDDYALYFANNGKEALTDFDQRNWQLAIIHFDLADMNGTELTALMKKQKPSLRVILIAGDNNPGDNMADRLLVHPVGDEFLLKQIKELFSEEWEKDETTREIVGPEKPFEVPPDLDVI